MYKTTCLLKDIPVTSSWQNAGAGINNIGTTNCSGLYTTSIPEYNMVGPCAAPGAEPQMPALSMQLQTNSSATYDDLRSAAGNAFLSV